MSRILLQQLSRTTTLLPRLDDKLVLYFGIENIIVHINAITALMVIRLGYICNTFVICFANFTYTFYYFYEATGSIYTNGERITRTCCQFREAVSSTYIFFSKGIKHYYSAAFPNYCYIYFVGSVLARLRLPGLKKRVIRLLCQSAYISTILIVASSCCGQKQKEQWHASKKIPRQHSTSAIVNLGGACYDSYGRACVDLLVIRIS